VREDVPYPNYAFYRQELERVFIKNISWRAAFGTMS
jgi:hypothetical protein